MLVAGDVYRPAAIDQLVILGEQVLYFIVKRNTVVEIEKICVLCQYFICFPIVKIHIM